jgi:hypothetical protein
VQAANAAPSRLHLKVEPGSLALKLKLAALELLGFEGPALIVASGGIVSIVQPALAVVLVLPAWSVDLTWKLCTPSASPL